VLKRFGGTGNRSLFGSHVPEAADLIIANPPYVRTQVMGALQAQALARRFGLTGRVDLYYAFLIGMSQVLKPRGIAGIIVSNRFMTTNSGAGVRAAVRQRFNLRHVWDLGDTKLFNAAVLPAVLLVEGCDSHPAEAPRFTSIYETDDPAEHEAADPIDALQREGVVETPAGRRFRVQHGRLEATAVPDAIWRVATEAGNAWLATVKAHTWGTFGDIGRVRVGVKTCADNVFIRSDWEDTPLNERPELLRRVTTHHVARRFRALWPEKCRYILYPHEVMNGKRRAVSLSLYPRSGAYLRRHRAILEQRQYVLEAGRM